MTPSLKRAHFTPSSGGMRSFFSAFLGVKWEKFLGIKPFETPPVPPKLLVKVGRQLPDTQHHQISDKLAWLLQHYHGWSNCVYGRSSGRRFDDYLLEIV
ncbi:hypothetical protein Sulac_3609 (plasmid) [Sulfobacillus acidophilus DSM 10332]|uniref:Uncharacterized protein n=1 Tax=Sulfobacillus acidophilus (strain ATCC 700253 / DSM 10332 / NAL) TaxID=679936 RepID=G8U1V5_SULAD|nr:hypothetical protein Sulac_3609 [Sulfobacillus acidophilus DSM 10332]